MIFAPGAEKSSETAARAWCEWVAFRVLVGVVLFGATGRSAVAEETRAVFRGPVAAYAEPLTSAARDASAALRQLHVEERSGVARQGELVRVPLFFAAGECASLDELTIEPDTPGTAPQPIVWQADDVRAGDDGGIARAHLIFPVDLAAGEHRRYRLVRRTTAIHATPAEKIPGVVATDDGMRFDTAGGYVSFTRDGALRAIAQGGGRWEFDGDGAFPRVELDYPGGESAPAASVVFDRATPNRAIEWSAGVHWHKLRIRLADASGAALELEYRVPRHGRELGLTMAVFPGPREDVRVKQHRLLEGKLRPGAGRPALVGVPAGLRPELRAEHAYKVDALAAPGSGGALLAVPLVIGGGNGRWTLADDGTLTLQGAGGLRRGDEGEKQTLRAFWTEVRLIPADTMEPAAWWTRYRERVQPLVAVVEEPGATTDLLHAALRTVAREMKPIGWRQEAARAVVLDDVPRMERILRHGLKAREADRAALLRGAEAARAKLTQNGRRRVAEHEKGRAYGGLDPYHITYTQSAAAALALFGEVPERVAAINHAMASAVREFGGRVDEAGYPFIDCFNRTLNMQMGPVLFGLTAGAAAGDEALAGFYRDLATAPPTLAVFGRAQRPYTGAPATSDDPSDYLYQAICDFWLRTTELLGGENLSLHPLAFARYTDCIDVMADRYHGVASRDKAGASGETRANFFRGQAHTHRWLGWSAAPYIRILETPEDRGAVGLTEAIRHTRLQQGRWKNWPDLTYYALTDLLVREALQSYERPALPERPADVTKRARSGAVELNWSAAPEAVAYRVYRAAREGGPYRWLNSPHRENPPPALTETNFRDTGEGASAEAVYVVTAVDAAGRESAWREFAP